LIVSGPIRLLILRIGALDFGLILGHSDVGLL
jgi:hypothetical protein